MKYIILAAGLGSRLLPQTELLPKILVPITGEKTTLDFQLHALLIHPIVSEIIIVVGYKAERIQKHLARLYADYPIPITLIHNSTFRETGPIYSLSLAIEHVGHNDFMIVNGDVVYEHSLLETVPALTRGCTLLIGDIASLDGDSLKVKLHDNQVLSVAKTIPIEQADGLSMGVFVVKGETAVNRAKVATHDLAQLHPKSYWHAMVNTLAKQGHVRAHLDSIHGWQEIDNKVDLQLAGQRSQLTYE